jgi:hypothetical protein
VGIELEDPLGRRVGTHVVPLLIEPVTGTARRDSTTLVSRWLASAALAGAIASDESRARWEQESTDTHRLFWQTALTRNRAIEEAVSTAATAPFQAGLFDYDTNRDRSVMSDPHRDLAGELTRRCVICERSLNAGPALARTVLVLLS